MTGWQPGMGIRPDLKGEIGSRILKFSWKVPDRTRQGLRAKSGTPVGSALFLMTWISWEVGGLYLMYRKNVMAN